MTFFTERLGSSVHFYYSTNFTCVSSLPLLLFAILLSVSIPFILPYVIPCSLAHSIQLSPSFYLPKFLNLCPSIYLFILISPSVSFNFHSCIILKYGEPGRVLPDNADGLTALHLLSGRNLSARGCNLGSMQHFYYGYIYLSTSLLKLSSMTRQ